MWHLWQNRFVLFALGLMIGIASFGGAEANSLGWGVLTLIFGLAARFLEKRRQLSASAIVLGCGAVAGSGLCVLGSFQTSHCHAPGGHPVESQIRGVLVGTVGKKVAERPDGWLVQMQVESLDGRSWSDPKPRVRLFFPKDKVGRRPARYGERIRVFVRLECYPPSNFPRVRGIRPYMEARGIVFRGIAKEYPTEREPLDSPVVAVRRAIFSMGVAVEKRLLDPYLASESGVALAVLLGNRAFVSDRLARLLRRSGLGHLLAISGYHFGVWASLLFGFAGWVCCQFPALIRRHGKRRIASLVVPALLGAYLVMIGSPASATRAWMATLAVCGGIWSGRPFTGIVALASAATCILVWRPPTLFEWGFQLSFGAAFSILVFWETRNRAVFRCAARGTDAVSGRLRRMRMALGTVTSACLGTWPFILSRTGQICLLSIALNLVGVPLFSLAVFPLLAFGTGLAFVSEPIAKICLMVANDLLWGIAEVANFILRVDWAVWTPGAVPLWFALLLYAIWVAAIGLRVRHTKKAVVLCLVGWLALYGWQTVRDNGRFVRLHFLPVGQGDSVLIELPKNREILIDAGGSRLGRDPGRHTVVPYIRRLGIERVEWIVGTHSDIDHVGGLRAVLRAVKSRAFVYPSGAGRRIQRLVESAREHGARTLAIGPQTSVAAGQHVDISVWRANLGPPTSDNNRSLLMRLAVGPWTFLATGDIERRAEKALVNRTAADADILKIPHHGSDTSSSVPFVRAVDPAIAVNSSGRSNPFGHPDRRVMRRYETRGVHLFGTGRHGLVVVEIAPGCSPLKVRPTLPVAGQSGN